jgi:hypothetical protein
MRRQNHEVRKEELATENPRCKGTSLGENLHDFALVAAVAKIHAPKAESGSESGYQKLESMNPHFKAGVGPETGYELECLNSTLPKQKDEETQIP